MRAIIQTQFGAPEVLQISELPIPQTNAEQLLIKVFATALNRADLLQRKGLYPPPPNESEILGLEIAGEVAACGEQVTNFKKGDRIFGLVGSGGYAEYCAIDAKMAMPIPSNLSFTEAAAIPEAFLTANEALFNLANLQKGQTILIHAGGSGVGSAAIQLAKVSQALVYTTAGSDQKLAKLAELGAIGINYKNNDFVQSTLQLTEGRGVDTIIDFIGANYFCRNLQLLKPTGCMVLVGMLSGSKTTVDLWEIISKRLQLKGLVMRSQSLAEKRIITQKFANTWLSYFANKIIQPVIDIIFPLNKIQEAHRYMEANKNFGKIVIDCS